METHDQIQERLKKVLEDERRELEIIRQRNFTAFEENRQHSARTIDHWILTASLGSFAIFLGFLKEISFTPLLAMIAVIDWIVFIWTSLIVLQTMILVKKASSYAQGEMEKDRKLININADHYYKNLTIRVEKLNEEAMFYFRVGIVLALIFAIAAIIIHLKIENPEFNRGYDARRGEWVMRK